MSIVCQCLSQKKPCLYINSGCNLVIDRIIEILTSLGADIDSSLSLLYIENSFDAYELYDILEKFQSVSTIMNIELQKFESECWGCVVIDSMTPFFQPLMIQDYLHGRVMMSHILQQLRWIARTFRIPVIV